MTKRLFALLLLLPVLLAAELINESGIKLDRELLKSAAGVTSARFPEADKVVLRENEFYTYENSGLYRLENEFYIKLLTEKGRESLRSLSFYFNTNYNKVTIQELCIIKADGKVIKVDIAKNSRHVSTPDQMSSNIYDPASRILVVTLPAVEKGDIICGRLLDETFKARIPNFWSNYSCLQADAPILENNIQVNAPAALPLRSIALKDEVKGTVTFSEKKAGDRIIYKWSAKNVPQVIHEPGMPELYTCVQRLLVSTAASWEEVSKWYWQLCRPRLDAVTPAMKKQVELLVKGKKEPMEKVKAIFQFVSQNIRYMGITTEKEAPGYEPHDVKITFEQRYGVCRDKAALLVTMFELAGFKAYPVLFMAGDPKDDEIPNGYFNHAVTAVELEKGNYVLMDPTFESTTDLFPAFLADMSYLVAHPQGEKLRRSPVVPSKNNKTLITTQAQIDSDYVLKGETTIKLSGVNDIYYRGAFSQWSGEQKRRFFTDRIQSVISGAELKEVKILPENIRDMSRNIEIKLVYSAQTGTGRNMLLLPLPEFSGVFGINEAVFTDFSLISRKYPVRLVSTCRSEELCTVTIPPNLQMKSLPEVEKFSVGKKFSFNRSAHLEGGKLTLKRTFDVSSLEVTAKEYPELKKMLNTLKNAAKVIPIAFKNYALSSDQAYIKAFPGADSVIEKYDVALDVKDESSWRVRSQSRRRILNYAGVKAHSEIKLPIRPGRMKIEKVACSVISPDGKVEKVKKEEINIMDAPGSGSAPRYPARKIMVISLPRVVPGSVVVQDITYSFANMPFFAAQYCFSSLSAPVLEGKLTLSAPERMYLKSSVTGPRSPEYFEDLANGRAERVWHFSNLARVKNESGQPIWQLFRAGVLLSSGSNRDYAELLNKALLEKVERSLPAARKLIEKEKWHLEKEHKKLLVKIRDYADKFIRMVPVPLRELPLSALSEASVTLNSGYGNSADRAIFLGAILKALKIDYHFAGVSGLGGTQSVTRLFNHNPDPEMFTERILLHLTDSGWYLNDTGRYAAPGSVRSENKLALDLSSGRLLTIQSPAQKESGRQIAFHVECRADDSALIQVTESLYGVEYERVKEVLATATPERRRRFFEERASAISHASLLDGVPEVIFDDYPGVLRYRVKAEKFVSHSGIYRIMPLPRYELFRRTGALPVAGTRTTPYYRNEASRLGIRYTITAPPGFRAAPGRSEKVQSGKYGSAQFTESCSVRSGHVTLHSSLYLPVELVSVLDFCELENRKRTVTRPEADRIIFEPIPQ